MLAVPRLGRVLKVAMVLVAIFGVGGGLLWSAVPGGQSVLVNWLFCNPAMVLSRPWTLVTAGLCTNPESYGHLVVTLLGLYFLGPDLERRWGGARFARLLLISVVAGFVLSAALDALAPGQARLFHPPVMFGTGAALSALATAWSRENPGAQIRLFFFLPVSGKALLWVTLGFCALGLVYPAGVPEGVASPFGGVIAGLLLGGTPSPLRTLYLRGKLAVLRRGSPPMRIDLGPERPVRRARAGGPELRVVPGGLGDERDKPRGARDKRYLN